MMNYEIIGKSFESIQYENETQYNAETEKFYEDQTESFFELYPNDKKMLFHFFESDFYDECYFIGYTNDINDYIERLAIKDGVNLVKFENGNIGYMASYSGRLNGFEIMETACKIRGI